MSPATIEIVMAAIKAASTAGHGRKKEIYAAACAQLKISISTFHRYRKELTVQTKSRKQRDDAGSSSLTLEEAQVLSALLIESIRKNDKQLSTIQGAVELLRANGKIKAERLDESTGELVPMSISAISRALTAYQLHPKQLLVPTPAVRLRSKHPNHVWEVDASISAQFYLADGGSQALDRAKHYEGKPQNLKKIERQRLWRYVITDHTSGTVYVEYVLGAESSENLVNVMVNAMQKRDGDPFHGAPWIIMTDPGAAMTSAVFRNLCRGLGIELIINKTGNARAKGQVEQAHNQVERGFEMRLGIKKVTSLDEINALAAKWSRYFNATAVHTRTGMTRFAKWMEITTDQLRIAPGVERCRELAVSAAEPRKVNIHLEISWQGDQYDVSGVPNIAVGQSLLITSNPWRDDDTAQVVYVDDEGHEKYKIIEKLIEGQHNFVENGAIIGEEFKSHAKTETEKRREKLEQIATGTSSVAEAEEHRKKKRRAFADINPHADVEQYQEPVFMPKAGTELEVKGPTVVGQTLNHIEAAKHLKVRLGSLWNADHFKWLKKEYTDGVPEEALDGIEAQLRKPVTKPALKVVGGK
ncbi:MAG: integrase [Oceanospirillaceae bacterium]|nr:integrase [Oceanospirillaceae bacterium]